MRRMLFHGGSPVVRQTCLGHWLVLAAAVCVGCVDATRPALVSSAEVAVPPPAQDASPQVHFEHDGADWCIHGGAALVGDPVVDDQGRVYLVTADGYLHAFEADGRYRFSYTVSGTPLGRLSLRASDQTILVGTTRSLVYAITQDGGLSWSFRTVSPVWSGLHALDDHSVGFLGLDRHLYALSTSGAARYRVRVPGVPTGEPLVDSQGVVWVPLDTGLARIEQAFTVQRLPFSSPVESVVEAPEGVAAVSGGQVWHVPRSEERSEPRSLGRGEFLSGNQRELWAFEPSGRGVWLTGGQAERLRLPVRVGGNPALAGDVVVVPTSTGALLLLDRTTLKGSTVVVAREPVDGVVLGHGPRVIVTLASGDVCGVTLPNLGDPPNPE